MAFFGKFPGRPGAVLLALAALCWLGPAAARAQAPSAEEGRALDARLMEEIREMQRLGKAALKLQAPRQALPTTVTRPVHIMFLFVDHWEPSDHSGRYAYYTPEWEAESGRLASFWLDDYARMTAKHRDADGRPPQHTWFTFQVGKIALDRIAQAVFKGLGEVEVHMHHGDSDDTHDDNSNSFRTMMRSQIETLQGRGALLSAELYPNTYFGFIHGDWALDNSRVFGGRREYCGVNSELALLRSLGCYGDFTFPSGPPTQPAWFNKIFASQDSPAPKSYSDPGLIRELAAGQPAPGSNELMLFEGPGPTGTWCEIDETFTPTLAMMDLWVNEYVHVPGREDWVFIKTFTHSAQALYSGSTGYANLVGATADKFYSDIERVYNDGVNYKLHYVTAREAYNIVRAAVDGKSGDPNAYRDYAIPPPANTRMYVNQPYTLLSYDAKKRKLDFFLQSTKAGPVEFRVKGFHAPCLLLESSSSKASDYHLSDAVITPASSASQLVARDATPSVFYRIVQDLPNAAPGWAAYR